MEDFLYLMLWIGLLGFVVFMVTTYIPMPPPWKIVIQVIGVVALIVLVLRFVASSKLFGALVMALALLAAPVAAGQFESLAAGILAMYAKAPPKPGPAPTPTPSGICDNCNGTGKLGDGTVFVVCPVCDGTGKKKTTGAVSQPAGSTSRQVAPPPVYRYEQPRRRWFRRGG